MTTIEMGNGNGDAYTTDRRLPSRDEARQRGVGSSAQWQRPQSTTATVLILTQEAGLGLALARLAEAQHLAVLLCWSALDLQRAPFWRFDVTIADTRTWQEVERLAGPHLASVLGRVPHVLIDIDDATDAGNGNGFGARFPQKLSERVAYRDGPAVALDAALRALHIETATFAPGPGSSVHGPAHEHARRRIDEARKVRVAIIEDQQSLADALWGAAKRRGLSVDLYVDVAHYREHAERRPAQVVVVGVDVHALRGVDLDAALAQSLGGIPGVLLTSGDAATEPPGPAGDHRRTRAFVHMKRTAPPEEILDSVLTLADRSAPILPS